MYNAGNTSPPSSQGNYNRDTTDSIRTFNLKVDIADYHDSQQYKYIGLH